MAAITSGSFIVLSSAAERRSTIGFGVLAGAYISIHVLSEASGWRFSVNGSGPVKNALLGGHVPIGAAALSAVLSVVRSGDLVALATSASKRLAVIPSTPTMKGTCDRMIPYACCSSSMLK